MAPDTILTDDYVAEKLAKEASDFSLRYSSMGLEAFNKTAKYVAFCVTLSTIFQVLIPRPSRNGRLTRATRRRPVNQPKPNTRFLNNIIRDTNSHNRALLAKESADSQARLKELERAEEAKRKEEERLQRRLKPGPKDTRKRMLGDINSIVASGSARKSRHGGNERSEARESRRRHAEEARHPEKEAREKRRRDGQEAVELEGSPTRKKSKRSSEDRGRRHSEHRRSGHWDRSRSRSRSRSRERAHRSRKDKHHEDTNRRHRDEDKRSVTRHADKGSTREHRNAKYAESDLFDGRNSEKDRKTQRLRAPSLEDSAESDSDPLEDLIGPSLPSSSTVRARGRGKTSKASGIDGRFSESYDPQADISLDDEEAAADDWGDALERLRDRQKWKLQSASRLRSAGFTEEQIPTAKKNDQEKTEADVIWSKKGEEREWDKGKGEI
jgi:hypothetical protein